MLRFILILVVVFLAVRLVLRVLGIRMFFTGSRSFRSPEQARTPYSREKKVEETDYEVLDSRLSDKGRDER